MSEIPPPQQPTRRSASSDHQQRLDEELVQRIADKVYAMLLYDLAIEQERRRPSARMMGSKGGW